MSAPITPTEIEACVPAPNSSMCGAFVKALLKLPTLLAKFFKWMLDSDGEFTDDFTKAISDLTLRPGDLIFSATPVIDEGGRLLCNGSAVSRTDYADLFAAIGTTYGEGNGTTTFNIPDYRARFPVGAGTFDGGDTAVLGTKGGEDRHVLSQAELNHVHVTGRFQSDTGGDGNDIVLLLGGTTGVSGTGRAVTGVGDVDPDENLSSETGKYTITSAPLNANGSAPTADTHDVTAHNNLPPYLPCYIYVKT